MRKNKTITHNAANANESFLQNNPCVTFYHLSVRVELKRQCRLARQTYKLSLSPASHDAAAREGISGIPEKHQGLSHLAPIVCFTEAN